MKGTFQSPYQICGDHPCSQFNGKPFEIIEKITKPDDRHDEEVLPMYVIKCDGVTFEAWPEEVE